jgi:hypothetical protein
MNRIGSWSCAATLCFLVACGSNGATVPGPGVVSANGDGSASVTGAFAGAPTAVASLRTAVAAIKTTPGTAGVSIEITNEAQACDTIINSGGFPEGATVLQLGVALSSRTSLPTPGTYTIDVSSTAGPFASAEYVSLATGACMETAHAALNQSTGTITLSAVSETEVSGTFDVGFAQPFIQGQPPNVDRVQGSFKAPGCPLDNPGPSSTKCDAFPVQ